MKKAFDIYWKLRFILLLYGIGSTALYAQETSQSLIKDSFPEWRIAEHAFTIGVGRTHVLDTYLSPITYAGPEVRLMYEKTRLLKRSGGKVLSQTFLQGHFACTQNPSKISNEYVGMVEFNFGWYYKFYNKHHLRLYAGLAGDLNAGCFYMKRNSNNPAQAKLYFNTEVSSMAVYNFRIKHTWLKARYQISAPFLGVMFSPEYGQSYYEIFTLKHNKGNVKFTHPVNQPSLRHYLSVDIPFHTYSMRIGYIGDFHQSKVNNLKCHTYSHLFMLGVVKRLFILKQKHGITY